MRNFRIYSNKKISYLSLWDLSLLLIPFLMFCLLLIFYFNTVSQRLNFQGVKAIQKKDFNTALNSFTQAVEEQPLKPFFHLNLALSYDLINSPLKSLQIYKTVSTQFKDSSQFFSYFNQAELNGRLNFLDEALRNYQEALEFNYKEKEIKENIELLFQNNQDQNKKNQDQKTNENKDREKQDSGSSGKGEDNPKDSPKQEEKDSKKRGNNVEKESKNEENNTEQNFDDVSEEQEKNIMKAIEQEEGKIRAKIFQNKNQYGNKPEKDW